MYFYVFDNYLQDRKYAVEIGRVETRLAALGLQGRQEKITILKNIQETLTESIKRGATTVVAVGNDKTVTKILPQIVEHGLILGLIPLGPDQTIAHYLGIPAGVAACDVLSRRIIRHLDVGKANSQYFLLQLKAPAQTTVVCDGKYSVESLDPRGTIAINNLAPAAAGSPDDGRLELVVQPAGSGGWSPFRRTYNSESVFPIRQAKLKCQHSQEMLILDGQIMVKTPTTVEVGEKKLEVIVGRARQF